MKVEAKTNVASVTITLTAIEAERLREFFGKLSKTRVVDDLGLAPEHYNITFDIFNRLDNIEKQT